MERINIYNNTGNLERSIARLYLFLLPIRMISPLLGVAELFHGAALYFDFFINIIGITIYMINHQLILTISNNSSDRAFKTFGLTVCVLNTMSIVMACITQITQGDYAGESAFSGILGMEIYFFQYVLIIAYNRRVFHILPEEEIRKILSHVCLALMILGYYQMLVLIFGGIFKSILDTVDVLEILWPDSSMWKLSLTGKEGAAAGGIFAIFVLPYLLGQLLEKGKNQFKIILQIILWIPVLVMMRSSSAYIMTLATTFGFFLCKFSDDKKKKNIVMFIGSILVLLLAISGSNVINILPSDIRYLMFEKALDMDNGSTAARFVPFVTNWKAFLEEPILGVGNGLQGYYYIEFFPDWAKNVAGSDVMTFYNMAKNTIVNGGLFFPSLLSGYGIVGVLLIANIFKIIKKRLKRMKHTETFAYNFFKISMWAIIVCGFQSEFAGNYLIWFVIGLPFMEFEGERK